MKGSELFSVSDKNKHGDFEGLSEVNSRLRGHTCAENRNYLVYFPHFYVTFSESHLSDDVPMITERKYFSQPHEMLIIKRVNKHLYKIFIMISKCNSWVGGRLLRFFLSHSPIFPLFFPQNQIATDKIHESIFRRENVIYIKLYFQSEFIHNSILVCFASVCFSLMGTSRNYRIRLSLE